MSFIKPIRSSYYFVNSIHDEKYTLQFSLIFNSITLEIRAVIYYKNDLKIIFNKIKHFKIILMFI
jgi:hypothetical protein